MRKAEAVRAGLTSPHSRWVCRDLTVYTLRELNPIGVIFFVFESLVPLQHVDPWLRSRGCHFLNL
jgi:hypothetical protein